MTDEIIHFTNVSIQEIWRTPMVQNIVVQGMEFRDCLI